MPSTFASVSVTRKVEVGSSLGSRVWAVSVFSVLAGRNFPCGSLAASTCPVVRLATSHEEAGRPTTVAAPERRAEGRTTTPDEASNGPPIVGAGAGLGRGDWHSVR